MEQFTNENVRPHWALANVTGSSAVVEQALNYEGGQTFNRSLREQTVQALTVGRFGNTFYASKLRLEDEAREVLVEARRSDPEFLARAIVYGREQGFLKDAPIVGLAILGGGGAQAKPLFEKIFDRVIQTPDDLRKFVVLCKSGTIPGVRTLGGYRRSAVKRWVSAISGYHAVKYGSAASRGMTIPDIVALTHPTTQDPAIAERLDWLGSGRKALDRRGVGRALNPQIRAAEALKLVADDAVTVALIRSGRLPAEFVIPAVTAMTPAIWRELLHQAPTFALLRSLVMFSRHGVFKEETEVAYVVEQLTDPHAIGHSKILPFRFFDAWRTYVAQESFDSRIADALRTAANLSFVNMPTLGGRTIAIGPDVSSSMRAAFGKGQTTYIDIAGIFTGALLRQIRGRAIALPFDDNVIDAGRELSGRDDVLVTAEKVSRLGGGGTALGCPIQHLLDRKIQVDAFVGITDNEDWAYGTSHRTRGSFLELWRAYRRDVNPEAQAFVIQIAPYQHAATPDREPGVHFIYGWSDVVVRYISLMLQGGESQLRVIEEMNLGDDVAGR